MLNETEYQNKSIFDINRKIDETFIIDYNELIKDFLKLTDDNNNYEFCSELRNKFDSDMIYHLKTIPNEELETEYKKILTKKEYEIYESFKIVEWDNTIENFIDYLDKLKDLNNPYITIQVGNKNENYECIKQFTYTKRI